MPQSRDQRRPWWTRTPVVVVLLLFCIATVAGMGVLVLREIETLSAANADNLQWSLAQSDVEFLALELALHEAQEGDETLADVRRRFDIFYSRMATLEQGSVYLALRENPDFLAPRDRVRRFLEEAVPLIDGDDATLYASLHDLEDTAEKLTADVRTLSLVGLSTFAELSDRRREEVVTSLFQMALVLALLLGGLMLLAVLFLRLYRMAERQARDVEIAGARTKLIVETSPDAILVTDSGGRCLDINQAASALFGYAPEEVRGKYVIEQFYPKDLHEELITGTFAFAAERRRPRREERRVETIAITRTGRRFPVEVSFDRAEDGQETMYVAYIRDISRRKQAEDVLTEARDKALAGERAKSEFLAMMSHEMRTPLNGLLGTMQLLHDHSLTEKQEELLNRMQSSGRQLLSLVNDVLDLSKYEAGKLETEHHPFSITRLMDGVVETAAPLAASNGNRLGWRWSGEASGEVKGDMRRLRQVLLNLVGNAVKFTRAGKVEIEVEEIDAPQKIVEFRVSDTGIGIAPDDLERIFNDFETLDSSYSRQTGGTGLGLGIARRLVESMGGEIGVSSEPGEGSLFWVRLPLPETGLPDTGTVLAPREADAQTKGASLSVLLVEDNETNRFVARQMLEAEGHRVTEAVDGRAGVEWAQAQGFDVILMDISMPVMDGQEAARVIRASDGPNRATPIIAVTAHALPGEIAGFEAAGMNECISKPIDRRKLVQTLRALAPGDGDAGEATRRPGDDLIDLDQLAALRDLLKPGDEDKLVARFLTETDTAIRTLIATDPASPELAAKAHKCAGSCATFGMVALREMLHAVEDGAGALEAEDLAELLPIWEDSRAALARWHADRVS